MQIKGFDKEVRLNTEWVNYNCGVRMAGRLRVEVVTGIVGKDSVKVWNNVATTADYAACTRALSDHPESKSQLIREFLVNLESANQEFIPPLRGKDEQHINPVFPNDSGRYVPTVILVADEVHIKRKHFPDWCYLIDQFQQQPEYHVEVHPGVTFNNSVYGSSPHISCVWHLVLPSRRVYVLKNGKLKFNQVALEKHYNFTKETVSPQHWAEIEPHISTEAVPYGVPNSI